MSQTMEECNDDVNPKKKKIKRWIIKFQIMKKEKHATAKYIIEHNKGIVLELKT